MMIWYYIHYFSDVNVTTDFPQIYSIPSESFQFKDILLKQDQARYIASNSLLWNCLLARYYHHKSPTFVLVSVLLNKSYKSCLKTKSANKIVQFGIRGWERCKISKLSPSSNSNSVGGWVSINFSFNTNPPTRRKSKSRILANFSPNSSSVWAWTTVSTIDCSW